MAVPLVLAGAACGDHGGGSRGRSIDTEAASADASLRSLEAAVPGPSDLPTRQQMIVVLGAIAYLGPVREVKGPSQRLYRLMRPGRRLHPPRFDIEATGSGVTATGRPTGCGEAAVTTTGGPRLADATPAATAFRLCRQRLGELGSQADGRFLLQTVNSPYVVVLYPYVEAFLASVRDVVADDGFRAGLVPGRFASLLQPGCGLQFYPATAAAIGWCADADGRHDPENDRTVAALGRALDGERALPAPSGIVG